MKTRFQLFQIFALIMTTMTIACNFTVNFKHKQETSTDENGDICVLSESCFDIKFTLENGTKVSVQQTPAGPVFTIESEGGRSLVLRKKRA